MRVDGLVLPAETEEEIVVAMLLCCHVRKLNAFVDSLGPFCLGRGSFRVGQLSTGSSAQQHGSDVIQEAIESPGVS